MAKDEHSAIPSWSGYIYQGKVAIYHVLRIVKDELNDYPNKTFDNYNLEIEWQEDFAILIDGNYETIHQVKAYEANSSPTFYDDALDGLFNKLSKNIGKKGYLNVQNPIKFTNRTASKNFEELKTTNQKSHFQSVLDDVEIYEYCNGNNYCDIDEIDILVLQKIEEIYDLNDFGINSKTMKQYEFIRYKIYDLLDTHIFEVHKGVRSNNETIPFNDILDIFRENFESFSREYEYIIAKEKLLKSIHKYCNDSTLCSLALTSCNNTCQLYEIEEEIQNMSSQDVFLMLKNASPHFESFDDIVNEQGLKFSLSRIFHKIDKSYKENRIQYKKGQNYYLASTLSGERNTTELSGKILRNKDLDLILNQFQIDYIISDDVNISDLKKEAMNLKNLSSEEDIDELFDFHDNEKINKIKKIEVKNLDISKGEIEC
ncbi:ABC-three component system protein [Aliarcobacter cryaerophilus]|uniref:ABC-three component system protein n=1 Tax=Aliarcobacter cryaerophilus TaxID=28198 RepID=UPI00112F71A6|nr:ABC-three component system protein [Aliarcobacter cryaerophilus]